MHYWTVTDNAVDDATIHDHVYTWPEQGLGTLLPGTTFTKVVGPLNYDFNVFKLEPREPLDFEWP